MRDTADIFHPLEHRDWASLTVGLDIDLEVIESCMELATDILKNYRRLSYLSSRYRGTKNEDLLRVLTRYLLWDHLEELFARDPMWVLGQKLPREILIHYARRCNKSRNLRHRRYAQRVLKRNHDDESWDWTAWEKRHTSKLQQHRSGSRARARSGVPDITTVGELRSLLKIGSVGQLGYLLTATNRFLHPKTKQEVAGPYVSFTIPKRDGSPREISAPKGQLKMVQRRLLREILEPLSPHPAAHGFVKGRSIVTNAQAHLGAKVVVQFDIRDFFPTIHYWRVCGLFASLGYEVGDCRISRADDSRSVAPVLARLCCYASDHIQVGQGGLPQGAPTSPAISNLICRRLDARLHKLVEGIGGVYTRYADDITFSFSQEPPNGIGRLRWWVDEICMQEGFTINQAKFRVRRSSQRIQVTGLVVNDQLRVPRNERRRFRAILHNCRKFGLASQAQGRKDFVGYLRGFASYVHMVHPQEGQRLLEEVEALLAQEPS